MKKGFTHQGEPIKKVSSWDYASGICFKISGDSGWWESGWQGDEKQSWPRVAALLKLTDVCREVHYLTHFTFVNGWHFSQVVLFCFVFKGDIFSDQPVSGPGTLFEELRSAVFQSASHKRSDMFSSWFGKPDAFYRIIICLGNLS